ncbi:MAG TPA: metal-sensitive transcriptional regulator [Tepidisphaeraceae bacterium]|nr:metal-sensitive transcriptional regulator [Tepidisphaeraceae bacterium]
MTPVARTKLQSRLNRIAGQVAGVRKMVDDDRYCVDILTQLAAIRSALDSVGLQLLTDHVEHCVAGHREGEHGAASERSKEELVQEVRQSIERFLK